MVSLESKQELSLEDIKENEQFKNQNIIGISDLNIPIFRVFNIDRLLQLIIEGKNTLVKPEKWDDPSENILSIIQILNQYNKNIFIWDIFQGFYGQCWTMNNYESDAMWRIYSPNKNGVLIKTTASKLYDSFFNIKDPFACIRYFIGKINYYNKKQIKEYFGNPKILKDIIFDSSCKNHIHTLLIKRKEFEHENEIRIIYRTCDEKEISKNIYEYMIKINDIIEEMIFDPRMDLVLYRSYHKIIKRLGYVNKIKKSTLYRKIKIFSRMET